MNQRNHTRTRRNRAKDHGGPIRNLIGLGQFEAQPLAVQIPSRIPGKIKSFFKSGPDRSQATATDGGPDGTIQSTKVESNGEQTLITTEVGEVTVVAAVPSDIDLTPQDVAEYGQQLRDAHAGLLEDERELVTDGGTHLREYPDACECGCGQFKNGTCARCGREIEGERVDADELVTDGGMRRPSWGSSKVGGLVSGRSHQSPTAWGFDADHRKKPEARHVLEMPSEDVGEDEEARYLVAVQIGTRYPLNGDGDERPGLRAAYADPRLEDVVVRHPLAVTDPEADLGIRPVDDEELPAVIGAEPGTGGAVEDVMRRRAWAETLLDAHGVTPEIGSGHTIDGSGFERASRGDRA